MTIAIAGGGIGGLVAGIALARRGFDVAVLEQQAEPREVGAGISVFANGAPGAVLVGARWRLGAPAVLLAWDADARRQKRASYRRAATRSVS